MLYVTDHITIHGIHGIISTDVDATISILTALPFNSSGQNCLECTLDRSWNVVEDWRLVETWKVMKDELCGLWEGGRESSEIHDLPDSTNYVWGTFAHSN